MKLRLPKLQLPILRFLDKNSALDIFWIYTIPITTSIAFLQETDAPWYYFWSFLFGLALMNNAAFRAGRISAAMRFRQNVREMGAIHLQKLKSDLTVEELNGGTIRFELGYGLPPTPPPNHKE